MKNVRERLVYLLVLCSDNKTEATKLQLLLNIIQSEYYIELSKSVALNKPFEDFYNITALEVINNNELNKRSFLLPKLVSLNKKIVQCIYFGNGPELTKEDLPIFTSLKSITKLINKINISQDVKNYSNISEENTLDIFSDTTIKSAKTCFDMLPISITKREIIDETTIKNYLSDTLYCVNIDEFIECHKRFLAVTEKGEEIIAQEKIRNKKHILFKISIIMLCFGAIYTCSQFSLLSDKFTYILTLITLITTLLFLILG